MWNCLKHPWSLCRRGVGLHCSFSHRQCQCLSFSEKTFLRSMSFLWLMAIAKHGFRDNDAFNEHTHQVSVIRQAPCWVRRIQGTRGGTPLQVRTQRQKQKQQNMVKVLMICSMSFRYPLKGPFRLCTDHLNQIGLVNNIDSQASS